LLRLSRLRDDGVRVAILRRVGTTLGSRANGRRPGRRLAPEDVLAVMRSLRAQGFHLQLPPVEPEAGSS